MSYLTGSEILKNVKSGDIVIEPFDERRLGPNSYNVCLGNELEVYTCDVLDMRLENPTAKFDIPEEGYVLNAGGLYLGSAIEYTESDKFDMDIDGRSSIGRLGLFVHVTAGRGDIGFKGIWTLELHPILPVRVYPCVEIGQLYFSDVIGDVKLYDGKYKGARGVQSSRLWREFKNA